MIENITDLSRKLQSGKIFSRELVDKCFEAISAAGSFLDVPAIPIPCHEADELPVGAMLFGLTGDDRKLLSIARGLEQVVLGRQE